MRAEIKTALATVLLLAAGGAALIHKAEGTPQPKNVDLAALPARIGPWRLIYRKDGVNGFESGFLNAAAFRIYRRADGKTVMLAISYSSDQKERFSLHPPDGCYRAAGLDVTLFGSAGDGAGLVLQRMLVQKGMYMEPVQYWIVLGGKVMTSQFERKSRQIYYSLFGTRAAGVLVKVSSLLPAGNDFRGEYRAQMKFIGDLYRSADPRLRRLLFGDCKPL
ncbi:MAG: EpsI family protein [Nitrospiraceae bacterium]|nr:EpsI family protein [Nitrospiraceae bacterium]